MSGNQRPELEGGPTLEGLCQAKRRKPWVDPDSPGAYLCYSRLIDGWRCPNYTLHDGD